MSLIKEFKTPILFLGKFLVVYLVLNILYGVYVDYYTPNADPITFMVTRNTEFVLDILGYNTSSSPDLNRPNVLLRENGHAILSVYEGCNGVNVFIIFVAFLTSFGRFKSPLVWYIPLGLIVIYITNLIRISLLFYVSKHFSNYLYFTHKYFFTAIIYIVVFLMWYIWVSRLYKPNAETG